MKKKTLAIVGGVLTGLLAACVGPVPGGQPSGDSSGQSGSNKLTVAAVVNTSDYKTAIVSMEKWAKEKGVELEVIEENTQTYASSYVLAGQTQNPRYDVIMFWDF
jgi:ABC-type glycerol-3-phosphate transport system substrate-binding protein